ncbi:Ig-like domain-containing protein [Pseudogemmatithrix spongiicola]|uniref:Ig-like domain-containing protein n=1 Tax=Pseudogemmatithrix spongiicola TaxID=3062599 RepID=A0AA49K1R7_9BACT|nr:Ig-like domain-containing protein [Gemmatimonadaceae bacterium 'strain 138']WKW16111.1 Ig-like domain-containing protein [Gemmatimonadaceae bacterium 'strain 318']
MKPTGRRAAAGIALFALSLLSCGREVTGPDGRRLALLAFAPEFSGPVAVVEGAGDAVPFERVRVVLRRSDGSIMKDTTVAFPSTADEVSLALLVPIPQDAPSDGLPLTVAMAYVNAAGDTVFRGGPNPVVARPVGSPGASNPVTVPVTYEGAGKDAATVTIAPRSGVVVSGTTRAFSATAFDGQGAPIAGTPFVFESLDPTRATVNPVSGVATWLPVRGTARIVASLPNGLRADTATMTVALPASKLVLASGNAQTGAVNTALANPIVLRTLASDDVPVEGVVVTFAVAAGGGALSVTTDTSDANGEVQTAWTLGGAIGAQGITATATGLTGSPLAIAATAVAGAPARLEITQQAATGVAGTALAPALLVIARDAFGNAVPAFTENVSVAVAGANPPTLGGTTSRAAVGGTATFNDLVLQRAGEFKLVVSSGPLTPDTTTVLQVAAGAAVKLKFVQQPTNAVAGATIAPPVAVRAYDAFNNVAKGFTGSIGLALLTAPGATLGGTTAVNAVDGVAAFADLSVATSGSAYRLHATSGGLAPDTSAVFNIAPGAPAQLALILPPPEAVVAGTAFDVQLRVRDAQGNTVPSYSQPIAVAFDAAPTGASFLSGNSPVVPTDGTAEFSAIAFDKIGVYRLRFSSEALGVVSADIQVTAGVAHALSIVSGNAQTGEGGTTLAQPLVAKVSDALGNPIAGATITWAVTSGGGSLDLTAVPAPGPGQSAAVWTLGLGAGPQTVRATADGLAPVDFSATATAATPATMAFVTQPANIVAGDTLPSIKVAVRNAAGQTIPDFNGSVSLALTGGTAGAALVGVATTEAVAGVATFANLTVNKGGAAYRLVASHAPLPTLQSDAFDVAAAPAATLTVLGGGGQSAPVATVLGDSIRVRLTDAFGFPVPGQAVQFTVTLGGGSASAASVVSDADGRASVRWTTGSVGPQQLRVHVGALEQLVSATAIASGPTTLFAGVDYTIVRVGGSRSVPLYLTNPSATPVEVTLTVPTEGQPPASWATSTVQFAPGATRVDATLNGLALGEIVAYVSSSVGEDSIVVTVDSSYVSIAQLYDYWSAAGDTIRTFVRISDPAPAGGIFITVRSSDTTVALVAPSSGSGVPAEGCFAEYCYGGDIQAAVAAPTVGGIDRLSAPPADSALVFIPEGGIVGEFAIVLLASTSGCSTVDITAGAAGFASGSTNFVVQSQYLYYYIDYPYASPANGVGEGQVASLTFYLGVEARRDTRVHFESSNPAVLEVDSLVLVPRGSTTYLSVQPRVIAAAADSAWLRFWVDGGARDSLPVFGTAPKLVVEGNLYNAVGGASYVQIGVGSAKQPTQRFRRAAPLTVTVTSTDPGVLMPERSTVELSPDDLTAEMGVRLVGSGSASLVFTAPGHEPDTVSFTTFTAGLSFDNSYPSLGVGQLLDHPVYVNSTGASGAGARTVTVTSSNPGIVEVVTPTVALGPNGALVRVRGVAAGSSTLTFSGPQLNSTNLGFTVGPTSLQLFSGGTFPPDGLARSVSSVITSAGGVRALADTARAVLRSSNPTVLAVADSQIVWLPRIAAYNYQGRVRPLAPGTATLWLVRPGVDSVSLPFNVTTYALVPYFPSVVVGEQLQAYFSLSRQGPDTLVQSVSVTSRQGRVSIHDLPATFGVGEYTINGRFVGESFGTDTLDIVVEGYAPMTQVVYVENTSAAYYIGEYSSPSVGTVYPYVGNTFSVTGVPGGTVIGKPLRLRVVPRDTSMVEAVQDTIEWAIGGSYTPARFATLRYKRVGSTIIDIVDIDGVIDGDSVEIYIEPADLYGSLSGYYGSSGFSIGMHQESDPYELYVQRGIISAEPLWVHLESSNPGLVSVPDSVLIEAENYYAYFPLVSGDTTGSAVITASAPGYNPWRFEVLVTRAVFELYGYETFTDRGRRVEVYAVDALQQYSHDFRSDVEARFTTTTPALIDAQSEPTFILPAGDSYAEVIGPRGVMAGSGRLGVMDARTARFDSVATGWEQVDVYRARLTPQSDPIRLSAGLRSDASRASFTVATGKDTAVVHLASLNGRFTAPDSAMAVGDFYYSVSTVGAALAGVVQGRDTLVTTFAGETDSIVVDIGLGILRSAGVDGQSIAVGDSILLQVSVLDAMGEVAEAVSDMTLSASVSDTSFAVIKDGVEVYEVTIPAGASSFQFWVQATSLGNSILTLSHPNFRSYQVRLNSVVRP